MIDESDWKIRVLRKTGGQKSKLGLIACAVLGVPLRKPPMISLARGAVITEDGWVIADACLKGQRGYRATGLGSLRDIVDSFRGLADVLKLSDADRVALFVELQKWMGTDLRARKKVELANW